jgi:hypothetical protein
MDLYVLDLKSPLEPEPLLRYCYTLDPTTPNPALPCS